MNKPLAYSAGGLLAVAAVIYGGFGSKRAPSAESLAAQALTAATPESRQRAALDLASTGPTSLPLMRRVLAESDSVEVRTAMVDGLGAARDWESMPSLMALLGDPSERLRDRAGVAVSRILGTSHGYRASDTPATRAETIRLIDKEYRAMKIAPPPIYRKPQP